MDVTLRVITVDGELVCEIAYDNEYQACEAMDDVVGEDIFVQVIADGLIYAEEMR